jgi:hypothetical protein
MSTKMKKLSKYLHSIKQKEVAESLTNKTFHDNAFLTQYINVRCGRHLKSDNWTKILTILNNNH